LPAVLRGADAALIPPTPSTRSPLPVFPMKVYEYLAAGPAGRGQPAAVDRGRGGRRDRRRADAFAAALDAALAGDSPAARRRP